MAEALDDSDCEIVEYNADEYKASEDEKPLLMVIKRIINSHDSQQNTVLTNSQLIEILQRDFNMEVSKLHPLEIDIYMNVMKKYLKHWPRWDEFDKIISKSKSVDDYELIDKILKQEYSSLKEYLGNMLEVSKPYAKEEVDSVQRYKKKKEITMAQVEPTTSNDVSTKTEKDEKVYLEIRCTRKQLNELFYRHPQSDTNQVFHVKDEPRKTINLETLSLANILNWPNINITIKLENFSFTHETAHELKHMLINKKLKINEGRKLNTLLDQNMKVDAKKSTHLNKKDLLHFVKRITEAAERNYKDNPNSHMVQMIFDMVKSDLNDIPEEASIPIPCSMKIHTNKYRYVRYLYKDVEGIDYDKEKYDLQLEEILSPVYIFSLGNIKMSSKINSTSFFVPGAWLKMECTLCKHKFLGIQGLNNLLQHFDDYHAREKDWQCTNCHKTFTMTYLTKNRWCHEC